MTDDLPISTKQHLLDLAGRLPEACRSEFVRGASSKLKDLGLKHENALVYTCLLYTSPSPRDKRQSRMPSSA